MKKSIIFRQHHFFEILKSFDLTRGPLDLFISLYFKAHPQLGSKDRPYIVEKTYAFFRWKALIEHILKPLKLEENEYLKRLVLLLEEDLTVYQTDTSIPEHIRVSFPKILYEAFFKTWNEKTTPICLALNNQAPLTLRANLEKTTREDLIARLRAQDIEACVDDSTPSAVRLQKRINISSLPEFSEGLFEMQDAGSQKIAELVQLQPGQSFLDFCAGSGGKSLACAPSLKNTGQMFLHDIRLRALHEAKRRLRRAGVQNAQIIHNEEVKRLKALKNHMDWVLVDAPCSGTGTLRRNPDMKWKFSQEMLDRLQLEQREIFAQAFEYVKRGGKIVYATCSLLKEENEEQMEHFLKTFPLSVCGEPFQSIPEEGKMDGFFAVCMQKAF